MGETTRPAATQFAFALPEHLREHLAEEGEVRVGLGVRPLVREHSAGDEGGRIVEKSTTFWKVIEWLERYYDERPPAINHRELDDPEFKQNLRRLLGRFRIKNRSTVGRGLVTRERGTVFSADALQVLVRSLLRRRN